MDRTFDRDLISANPNTCRKHPAGPRPSVAPTATLHAADCRQFIRHATTADTRFVRSLARRFSNQIGHLPDTALDTAIRDQRILVNLDNGQHAGFLLTRTALADAPFIRPIIQAAVCLDAQRRHHGLALVARLAADALQHGQQLLQAWCRADLESNAFWAAAGFTAVARRHALNARGAHCILWRRPVQPIAIASLFHVTAPSRPRLPGGRFADLAQDTCPTIELLNLDGPSNATATRPRPRAA